MTRARGRYLAHSYALLAKIPTTIAVTALLASLTIGGTGSVSQVAPASAAANAPVSSVPTVKAAHTKLGDVLVDAKGMVLYRYTADKNDASACSTTACLQLWPVLSPTPGGQPIAGPGVSQHALGVITRKDGKKQVTYDGWPLYTYFVDRAPGQIIGQGVKDTLGTWYVVYASPAKNPTPKS